MRRKYDPLREYLQQSKPERVKLSFAAIQKLLEDTLPKSAYSYREWWANQLNTANRPQAAAWLETGWRVGQVFQHNIRGWVEFIRA